MKSNNPETVHNSSWRPPGELKISSDKVVSSEQKKTTHQTRRVIKSGQRIHNLFKFTFFSCIICHIVPWIACQSSDELIQPEATKSLQESQQVPADIQSQELGEDKRNDQARNSSRQGKDLGGGSLTGRDFRPILGRRKILRFARSTTISSLSWQSPREKLLPVRIKVPNRGNISQNHFPNLSPFLLPFGRKISESPYSHRKAITQDVIKPSNIRKRNFSATVSQVLSDSGGELKSKDVNSQTISDDKLQKTYKYNDNIKGERTRGALLSKPVNEGLSYNNREMSRISIKRPISNRSTSTVGKTKPSGIPIRRGRVKISRTKLGLYQKRLTTTSRSTQYQDDDIPQRPSKRERIRNLRIRRPINTNLNETTNKFKHISSTVTPITKSSEVPSTTQRLTTPYQKLTATSASTIKQNKLSTTKKPSTTTEKMVSLKGLPRKYKDIFRSTAIPSKSSSSKVSEVLESSTISLNNETILPDKETIKMSTDIVTSTTKSSNIQSNKVLNKINDEVTKTTTKPSIDATAVKRSNNTSITIKTPEEASNKTKEKHSMSNVVTKELNDVGVEETTKSHHLNKAPSSEFSSTKPTKAKNNVLEEIKEKISRFKVDKKWNQRMNPSVEYSKLDGRKPITSLRKFNTELNSPSLNSVSSTRPPFFRPISFPPKKSVKSSVSINNKTPNVKIYVNLPDTKPGSVVKLPNVSHIQDKLARLNAAITQGLKLQRQREEEEAAMRKDWEDKDDASYKLSPSESVEIKTSSQNKTSSIKNDKLNRTYIRGKHHKPLLTTTKTATTIKIATPSTTTEKSIQIITTLKSTKSKTTKKEKLVSRQTTLKTSTTTKIPTTPSTTIHTSTTTTPITTSTSSTTTTIAPEVTSTTTTTKKHSIKNDKYFTKKPHWKKKDIPHHDHPSSHLRPSNWTGNNPDFIPMPKSNLPERDENNHIFIETQKGSMYMDVKINNNQSTVTSEDDKPTHSESDHILGKSAAEEDNIDLDVVEDITGTTVYVIAVLAAMTSVGILAWFVRIFVRRKMLRGSESSSETGLHRPIAEEDSLQISGRMGFSHPNHCFETIAEAPENIPKVDNAELLGFGSIWDFPRSSLRLQTVLGEGNFGKVWKAEADDICGHEGTILVAVKTVKEKSAKQEIEDLIEEMKIMQEIGSHPNVVTILGVCTEQEPYLLIMEYIMYGKLLTHLREQRTRQSSFFNFSKDSGEAGETLTSKDLNKFAYGVAKGMEFLVSKGVRFLIDLSLY